MDKNPKPSDVVESWDADFVAKVIEMLHQFAKGGDRIDGNDADASNQVARMLEDYFYGELVSEDEIRAAVEEDIAYRPNVREFFEHLLRGTGLDLKNHAHLGLRFNPVIGEYVLDIEGQRPAMIKAPHVDLTHEAAAQPMSDLSDQGAPTGI